MGRNVLYVHKKQHLNSINTVFFCSTGDNFGGRKRISSSYLAVRTLDFQRSIEKACQERNDASSNAVRCRMVSVTDLIAADARYHQNAVLILGQTNSSLF